MLRTLHSLSRVLVLHLQLLLIPPREGSGIHLATFDTYALRHQLELQLMGNTPCRAAPQKIRACSLYLRYISYHMICMPIAMIRAP